jgi:hypothetical protein
MFQNGLRAGNRPGGLQLAGNVPQALTGGAFHVAGGAFQSEAERRIEIFRRQYAQITLHAGQAKLVQGRGGGGQQQCQSQHEMHVPVAGRRGYSRSASVVLRVIRVLKS